MIGFAQNITNSMRLTFAMHKLCAQLNHIAQNDKNSVRSRKSMHNGCAFKKPRAQKFGAFESLREIKKVCN